MSRLPCAVLDSGVVELFFYDELDRTERDRVSGHLAECRECAEALQDLAMIRRALASRPDVSAPKDHDWSAFMTRLDAALLVGQPIGRARKVVAPLRRRVPPARPWVGWLATAALLALVTINVLFVARQEPAAPSRQGQAGIGAGGDVVPVAGSGLRSAGEKHFERSKLVVLGLAERGPQEASPEDWAYERELATSLLNDTRLYRMAAEQRGLRALAGVMRDLELVLLETSMAQETDPAALEQIQRLIRKRGLVQKMDTVAHAGMTP